MPSCMRPHRQPNGEENRPWAGHIYRPSPRELSTKRAGSLVPTAMILATGWLIASSFSISLLCSIPLHLYIRAVTLFAPELPARTSWVWVVYRLSRFSSMIS